MIKTFARWVVRHPVWVLVGIGIVTVGFSVFIPGLTFFSDLEKMLPQDDPVVERFEATKDAFGSQSMVIVAMAAPEGQTVFNLGTLRKLYALTDDLSEMEREGLLEDILSPATTDTIEGTETSLVVKPVLPGPPGTEAEVDTFRTGLLREKQAVGTLVLEDGSAVAIILKVHPNVEGNQDKIDEIMGRVNTLVARYEDPETFHVTGDTSIIYYAQQYMRQDLARLLPIVVLVVLAVLFASFRSMRGTLLPIAVVAVAVIWTLGLMALCGVPFTIASVFLPVLLVAIGSAYGIHVVNDYFERVAPGVASREELLTQVVQEMADPVFGTAITTLIGFITLLTAFLSMIRQFGLFAAAGVFFSFVISLTLIPAILAVTPTPRARRRTRQVGQTSRWNARHLAELVNRRRWIVLAVAVVLLGCAAALIPQLRVETDLAKYFRQNSPVIEGMSYVEDHFGGSLQMNVVIDTGERDGVKSPEVLGFMDGLQNYMASLEPLGKSTSLVDLVKESNCALHGDDNFYYAVPDSARGIAQVILLFEMGGGDVLGSMVTRNYSQAQISVPVKSVGTDRLQDLLEDVSAYIEEHCPTGVMAYTTGMPSVYVRMSQQLVSSQMSSLLASAVGVGVVAALLMGSVGAGLLCLIPLLFSVVGNFGTMALVGADLDVATVMIASIVIGIGVDYSIHFLTRYRRERAQGLSHVAALANTYGSTGRAIVYNALTLAFGFLVLTLSHFGALQTLGWLVALTMVTSALGALLILPIVLGLSRSGFVRARETRPSAERGQSPAGDGQT